MFSLTVTDTGELRRFKKELPKIARRVVVRVANDAVPVAKDAILRRWNVSPAAIDSALRVTQSNDSTWWNGLDKPKASIIARGRQINLFEFPVQQTPQGVTAEVRKGGKVSIPHAFIAETLQGYGRKAGQSKRALKKVIKNLRAQKQAEQRAARAEFASRAQESGVSAARWNARASRESARYTAATKRYQAQRAILNAMGATRSGVFVRTSKARLPIKALYGGSIQSFFASGEVSRDLTKFCTPAIAGYMESEIKSFFGGR